MTFGFRFFRLHQFSINSCKLIHSAAEHHALLWHILVAAQNSFTDLCIGSLELSSPDNKCQHAVYIVGEPVFSRGSDINLLLPISCWSLSLPIQSPARIISALLAQMVQPAIRRSAETSFSAKPPLFQCGTTTCQNHMCMQCTSKLFGILTFQATDPSCLHPL